jgi:hypothetical protein
LRSSPCSPKEQDSSKTVLKAAVAAIASKTATLVINQSAAMLILFRLGIKTVRRQAELMETETQRFYEHAASTALP